MPSSASAGGVTAIANTKNMMRMPVSFIQCSSSGDYAAILLICGWARLDFFNCR
jgi:hypothetical protein